MDDLTVAWASYEKSDEGPAWMGARCDACGMDVPVSDGRYDSHVREVARDGKGEPPMHQMCDGSGAECRMDAVEYRGAGKWVLLSRSTGEMQGSYGTREEAAAMEKTMRAAKVDSLRVRRFERFDLAKDLPAPQRTVEGFWRVAGKVAREGIQEYRDGRGGVRRELRLPEEVGASVPSFALQPLTNDHPPEMVAPDNAQKYVVGAVGEAQFSGGWVTAPITIYAADAIAAVERGRAQLSVGYSCRLEDAPGEWRGQKYDGIQRDIVVNHVALVDVARAGSQARLRLDASDAEALELAESAERVIALDHSARELMPHELRIDGLVFQVTDPNAQAAYDRALKQREDARAEAVAQRDTAQAVATAAVKDKDKETARADNAVAELKAALSEKLDGLDVTIGDARDPAKLRQSLQALVDVKAAARASLLVEARKHLGANEKFDAYVDAKTGKPVPAKSDLEIKRAVVEKLDKDVKLDGKSEDYVQARYDGLIEAVAKASPRAIDLVRRGTDPTNVVAPAREDAAPRPTDAETARRAMVERAMQANVKNARQ